MSSMMEVTISKSNNDEFEYIIRDKNKIVIGRFLLLELDKDNKRCNVKLKFYRKDDRRLLTDTLKVMLKGLFNDIDVNKVNVYIEETLELSPFLDMGFILEGILSNNIYIQGTYYNELIMGINRYEYNEAIRSDFSEIVTENLRLKILTPENSKELLNYYLSNKKHLERFEPQRDMKFYTEEVQRNILSESYRQFLNGSSMDFGIFKEEKLIGKIKISNIVYGIFKSGVLGYSIDMNEQGKGFMKEAVNNIVDYSFSELGLHRLEASALVDNEKSKRVLISCGFEELGINKKYLFINGKWRDHITYYKIK